MTQLDPEQEITVNVLSQIKTTLMLHEEVPPRLLYRALDWSMRRIMTLEQTVDLVKDALERPVEIG
jgi:hypothetical protein